MPCLGHVSDTIAVLQVFNAVTPATLVRLTLWGSQKTQIVHYLSFRLNAIQVYGPTQPITLWSLSTDQQRHTSVLTNVCNLIHIWKTAGLYCYNEAVAYKDTNPWVIWINHSVQPVASYVWLVSSNWYVPGCTLADDKTHWHCLAYSCLHYNIVPYHSS